MGREAFTTAGDPAREPEAGSQLLSGVDDRGREAFPRSIQSSSVFVGNGGGVIRVSASTLDVLRSAGQDWLGLLDISRLRQTDALLSWCSTREAGRLVHDAKPEVVCRSFSRRKKAMTRMNAGWLLIHGASPVVY